MANISEEVRTWGAKALAVLACHCAWSNPLSNDFRSAIGLSSFARKDSRRERNCLAPRRFSHRQNLPSPRPLQVASHPKCCPHSAVFCFAFGIIGQTTLSALSQRKRKTTPYKLRGFMPKNNSKASNAKAAPEKTNPSPSWISSVPRQSPVAVLEFALPIDHSNCSHFCDPSLWTATNAFLQPLIIPSDQKFVGKTQTRSRDAQLFPRTLEASTRRRSLQFCVHSFGAAGHALDSSV